MSRIRELKYEFEYMVRLDRVTVDPALSAYTEVSPTRLNPTISCIRYRS